MKNLFNKYAHFIVPSILALAFFMGFGIYQEDKRMNEQRRQWENSQRFIKSQQEKADSIKKAERSAPFNKKNWTIEDAQESLKRQDSMMHKIQGNTPTSVPQVSKEESLRTSAREKALRIHNQYLDEEIKRLDTP